MGIFRNKTPEFLKDEVMSGKKRPGLLHTRYFEQMPTYEKAEAEFILPDALFTDANNDGGDQRLNCAIVFGRDRDSHLMSGYGKIGGTPCAAIDIVAGRMSSANTKRGLFGKKFDPVERTELVGRNFFTDASRIYISQKCDIDHYFGIPDGKFGRPRGEAGIGIKSDHVRIIGRDSIKLFAGSARAQNLGIQGELNSNGDQLVNSKIEFITDLNAETQPLVLGSNLVEFLDEVLNKISDLQQAFFLQNINIIKLESALAGHFHIGGGLGYVTVGPDPILASVCLNDIKSNVQKISDNISNVLNFEVMRVNYLGLPNSNDPDHRIKTRKNILSSNVYTT